MNEEKIMRVIVRVLACVSASAALCGCLTMREQDGADAAAREREDILMLRDENARIRGRIETLEMEYRQITRDVGQMKTASSAESDRQRRETDRRLAEIEQKLQAVDAAREKDRVTIVEELSKRIAQIMAQRPSAASYSGPVKGRHEVRDGETLSSIAQQYGVRASVIAEANDLANPDLLRKGQTLIIPGQ